MTAASTWKWIFSYQPIDFYLSRILLLCNLIPLNVGPRSQFDYRRRVGKVEVSWRWHSMKFVPFRSEKAMNKDVGYNYVAGPV